LERIEDWPFYPPWTASRSAAMTARNGIKKARNEMRTDGMPGSHMMKRMTNRV